MGTTALRQLLSSLCHNSDWTYAIFWRLKQGNQTLLTWEDGYCDVSKPKVSSDVIQDDTEISKKHEMVSLGCETSLYNEKPGGCSIRQAVADMSCFQYSLGEGIVGEVASTGNHCWVYPENILTSDFCCNLVHELPDEWPLQLAAGVKTILLVPVVPHGVVQLGSLQEVHEDLTLVANIKDSFNEVQNFAGYSRPSFSNRDLLVQSSLSMLSILFGSSDDSSAVTDNKPSFTNQVAPLLPIQEEIMESNLFDFSCPEEELMVFSQRNSFNAGSYFESCDEVMKFYPDGDMIEQSFGDNVASCTSNKSTGSFFSFPVDSELHKALGLNVYMLDSIGSVEAACDSDLVVGKESSDVGSSQSIVKGGDMEHLLEAVIANVNSISDTSDKSSSIVSSRNSSEQLGTTLVGDDSVSRSHAVPAFGKGGHAFSSSPNSASSLKIMMSTVVDEEKPKQGYINVQAQKGAKLSNGCKRRAKPVEKQRQRPRDRQMIQDRVKELRELVPNGEKCSIDGLLDRTINHMLFLRNVTSQAEKLSQWVHKEVDARKNRKSFETKSGSGKSGTSWAFEVGGEHETCPIVVEDLECPGHILIEMVCDEHGLFLEIAQIIRRLDLTILKGVMESRSNNTWAHFIVEVSGGFHRMDIFWPLMQLLQRKGNPVSSRI